MLDVIVFGLLFGIPFLFLVAGLVIRGGFLLPLIGGILGMTGLVTLSGDWRITYYSGSSSVLVDFNRPGMGNFTYGLIIFVALLFIVALYQAKRGTV